MNGFLLLTERLEQSSCQWDAVLLQEALPPNGKDILDHPEFAHMIFTNEKHEGYGYYFAQTLDTDGERLL